MEGHRGGVSRSPRPWGEDALSRAWEDTWGVLEDRRVRLWAFFYSVGLTALGALVGIWEASIGLAIGVVFFAAVFFRQVVLAPLRQRNEAREELARLDQEIQAIRSSPRAKLLVAKERLRALSDAAYLLSVDMGTPEDPELASEAVRLWAGCAITQLKEIVGVAHLQDFQSAFAAPNRQDAMLAASAYLKTLTQGISEDDLRPNFDAEATPAYLEAFMANVIGNRRD